MNFKGYIEQLSADLIRVGWYIVKYDHFIEAGQYHIQFQKVVRKNLNNEPYQIIISHDVLIDELDIYNMYCKELNKRIIIELGKEDVKA